MTRAPCTPLLAGLEGASKVRNVQQLAHREVELISIQGVYRSKADLNLTYRWPGRKGGNYANIFTRGPPPRRANARLGFVHAHGVHDICY